jgi:4-amino-4-deoxy-L-arabinose transferase-like glycosyltransferase
VTAIAESIADSKQRTQNAFLFVLGAYFVLQIVIRVLQGGAVEMDEAEQIFYAQHFRLGYENQPPLYTWVQAILFKLFGINHFGLALAKNIFMFVLYASVYQTARPLLGTLGAATVTSSLIMIVTLGWEAQIDRTHSILATAVAAASLWAYYALLRHPARPLRALLGLLFGLGMLSKYNFLVFALGLAGASLLVPEHRRVVWTRDAWITPAVAAICVVPHAAWFFEQIHVATAETLRKMHEGGAPSTYGLNLLTGSKHFFLSIVSFVTPLWLPLAFAWRGRKPGTPRFESQDVRLFFWLYATGLGGVAALVLAGQLVHLQSRWLQPLLFSFPLAFFLFFPPRSDRVYRRLLLTMAIFCMVLVTALALRPQIQSALGRHPRIFQPYGQLAAEVEARFPGVQAFAVQDRFVGGNIKLRFPGVPVVLFSDACALQGKVLVLSGDSFDDRPRAPMPACPGMRVIEHGQMRQWSVERPREQVVFDYALVTTGGQPRPRRNDLVTVVVASVPGLASPEHVRRDTGK